MVINSRRFSVLYTYRRGLSAFISLTYLCLTFFPIPACTYLQCFHKFSSICPFSNFANDSSLPLLPYVYPPSQIDVGLWGREPSFSFGCISHETPKRKQWEEASYCISFPVFPLPKNPILFFLLQHQTGAKLPVLRWSFLLPPSLPPTPDL